MFIGNDRNPLKASQSVHHDREVGAGESNGGLPMKARRGGEAQKREGNPRRRGKLTEGEATEKGEEKRSKDHSQKQGDGFPEPSQPVREARDEKDQENTHQKDAALGGAASRHEPDERPNQSQGDKHEDDADDVGCKKRCYPVELFGEDREDEKDRSENHASLYGGKTKRSDENEREHERTGWTFEERVPVTPERLKPGEKA